ncbi:amino acid permease [Halococcus thailandensis]|uniref:UspA domain-containing protein n=1 Tax=Halococcus thailandensis JCM 13552 TaxID=1227457 RepID=M0NDX0_9EURY|nr:amino acid permease [Halococcus thailandensis]EMA56177.1 UspA domain-containing protein [Halococcus thailandensis JCM 13552]
MAGGAPDHSEVTGVETELDRDIGFVGAVALGVGTMIAAGIFVLSGLAVSNVGVLAIGSFLIAAFVASFTAFAYAEFASLYPESGGGYAYVANTFDRDWTYIVGWSMILGYPASAAFYLASFGDWFYRFIYPLLSIPAAAPYWLSAVGVLALLIGINLKGTEETGLFQIIVTALKIMLIGLFLFGGLQAFNTDVIGNSISQNTQGFADFRDIAVTSSLVFITFFGFEAIATNAEEIEEPGTTIPRAIFFSMGFVTVVYALVVLVIVFAVNNQEFLNFLAEAANLGGVDAQQFIRNNGEVSMAYAAQYYLGPVGFYIIIVGALLSMVSAANATILAGSRVKLAMSRRDHLPDRFEKLHPSFNTPYQSVFLTGGLIVLYIFVFTVLFGGGPKGEAILRLPFALPVLGSKLHLGIEAITHFADFMLLTGLIVVNIAIVRSRRKFPDLDRGFEVPAVPWVPVVAVLATLVLLVNVEPSSILLGLLAEVIGVAFWFAWKGGAPTTEEIERETPTAVAEHNPSGHDRDYRIVVPIANPDHVEQLMRTAIDLARDRNGEVLVLSVVSLPEQTPLSRGRQYVDERREVLNRAMALADGSGNLEPATEPTGEAADVPVSGTVRIAHHVDDAILHTIEQYDTDAVLMGWGGWRARRREVVLGSIVDTVVTEADCDVLVERIDPDVARTIESILLPTAGGPHAELAGEIATAIARAPGAHVELLRVVASDATEGERDDAKAVLKDTLAGFGDIDAEGTVVENDDVVDAITERSAAHDLTVIGATREGLLQRVVFGAIPEQVGEKADSTVILAKRDLELTSRLRRLFGRE